MTAATEEQDRLMALQHLQSKAREAAMGLASQHLNVIAEYMDALHTHELFRCSTLESDVHIRRSQGAAAAYSVVHELLQYQPVEKRRSVSRQEV